MKEQIANTEKILKNEYIGTLKSKFGNIDLIVKKDLVGQGFKIYSKPLEKCEHPFSGNNFNYFKELFNAEISKISEYKSVLLCSNDLYELNLKSNE